MCGHGAGNRFPAGHRRRATKWTPKDGRSDGTHQRGADDHTGRRGRRSLPRHRLPGPQRPHHRRPRNRRPGARGGRPPAIPPQPHRPLPFHRAHHDRVPGDPRSRQPDVPERPARPHAGGGGRRVRGAGRRGLDPRAGGRHRPGCPAPMRCGGARGPADERARARGPGAADLPGGGAEPQPGRSADRERGHRLHQRDVPAGAASRIAGPPGPPLRLRPAPQRRPSRAADRAERPRGHQPFAQHPHDPRRCHHDCWPPRGRAGAGERGDRRDGFQRPGRLRPPGPPQPVRRRRARGPLGDRLRRHRAGTLRRALADDRGPGGARHRGHRLVTAAPAAGSRQRPRAHRERAAVPPACWSATAPGACRLRGPRRC